MANRGTGWVAAGTPASLWGWRVPPRAVAATPSSVTPAWNTSARLQTAHSTHTHTPLYSPSCGTNLHDCIIPTSPSCGTKLHDCIIPTSPSCGTKLHACVIPTSPSCGTKLHACIIPTSPSCDAKHKPECAVSAVLPRNVMSACRWQHFGETHCLHLHLCGSLLLGNVAYACAYHAQITTWQHATTRRSHKNEIYCEINFTSK
jgi:hypothetical protein